MAPAFRIWVADFAAASGGQVSEKCGNDLAGDVGEGVAVEEEKWRLPVARAEEFYGFVEGGEFGLSASPLCFKRCIAL